jgi:hypothetical protein
MFIYILEDGSIVHSAEPPTVLDKKSAAGYLTERGQVRDILRVEWEADVGEKVIALHVHRAIFLGDEASKLEWKPLPQGRQETDDFANPYTTS